MPVIWVARERIIEVLRFLRNLPAPTSCSMTCMAWTSGCGPTAAALPNADFTVFYHLLSIDRNSDVMLKVALSANDLRLPTATGIFPTPTGTSGKCWTCTASTSTDTRCPSAC